jgi:L,D-transpeptidase catalytic domain
MKNSLRILIMLFVFGIFAEGSRSTEKDNDVHQLWFDCKLEGKLPYEIFKTAVDGRQKIDKPYKKNLITIIDYSKPSTQKRFFVIDLEKRQLIYCCLVAHGKNSGENYAKNFSNENGSLKSSLGFYLTAEAYKGEHGYSLRLDGLEKGINDNARIREIVIHGATYVSDEFIKKYGMLGRSWGCPALPVDLAKEIIDKISGGSCIFIYADDAYFKENSVFLKKK